MAIFAFMPLQLRYATEARPYAQAVCLSVLCTLIFLLLVKKTTPLRCIFYLGTVLAGIYTQPFAFFVPLAHWIWLAISSKLRARKALLPILGGLLLVSALAFWPWYLYARHLWRASVDAGKFHFVFGWKEVLVLSHELVGGGYFGTVLILSACTFGLLRSQLSSTQKWLWIVLLTVPLVGPVLANVFFGYFIAIRQFIFLVPALAVLSALGIESLYARKQPLVAASYLVVLAAIWLISDIRWFTKPRENWGKQAATLEAKLNAGGCVIFIPQKVDRYFTFFNPHLNALQCSPLLSKNVWLAVSPYEAEPDYQNTTGLLVRSGFVRQSLDSSERPRLELFELRP